MNKRLRYSVVGLICAILIGIVYWQDIFPLKRQLTVAQENEKKLLQELKDSYEQEVFLARKMIEIPEAKAKLMEFQQRFIKKNDLATLLKEIVTVGKKNRLHIQLFELFSAQKEDHYFKQPIKIGLMGDYLQVANFINRIANLPWVVIVEDFALLKVPASEEFSTEIELGVYYQ